MARHRGATIGVALVLSTALTGPAHATPVLQGTTKVSAALDTLYPGCSGACAAFFAAGCPDDMADADGLTTSIVDVHELGGTTLRFSWTGSSTRTYDRLEPHAGNATPDGRMLIYLVDSCVQPTWFSFALDSPPAGRTKEVTIPESSTWIVAQAAEATVCNSWWAESVD
jgi:hypothetical protein